MNSYTQFADDLCNLIVTSTNEHSVRSSKRTDDIHTKVASFIEEANPRVTCVIEDRLSIATGTIKVDIVVKDKQTQSIVACVSLKASMNNVLQNRTNNENVKCGEAIKITSAIPLNAKLVFLDIVPDKTPYYTKDGTFKHMETNTPSTCKERESKLMAMVNQRAEIISDIYTVFPSYVWESRASVKFDKMVDCSDLERMVTFIQGLAPV
jgi:ribosomal protein L31